MQSIVMRPLALAGGPNGWRPAAAPPPRPMYNPVALGQQQQQQAAPPPMPAATAAAAAVPPKPAFIDSALFQTGLDVAGVVASGILAYGATYPGVTPKRAPSPWAYFFGVVSGGFILKTLLDLSRVRTR